MKSPHGFHHHVDGCEQGVTDRCEVVLRKFLCMPHSTQCIMARAVPISFLFSPGEKGVNTLFLLIRFKESFRRQ